MTPTELLSACERSLGQRVGFIVLVVPRRRHGKRVRLFPGVLGTVVGSDRERLHVSVAIADIKLYLLHHLSKIEGVALSFAEAGDHEQAEKWLAEYVAVRDRLSAAGMWRSRV